MLNIGFKETTIDDLLAIELNDSDRSLINRVLRSPAELKYALTISTTAYDINTGTVLAIIDNIDIRDDLKHIGVIFTNNVRKLFTPGGFKIILGYINEVSKGVKCVTYVDKSNTKNVKFIKAVGFKETDVEIPHGQVFIRG